MNLTEGAARWFEQLAANVNVAGTVVQSTNVPVAVSVPSGIIWAVGPGSLYLNRRK